MKAEAPVGEQFPAGRFLFSAGPSGEPLARLDQLRLADGRIATCVRPCSRPSHAPLAPNHSDLLEWLGRWPDVVPDGFVVIRDGEDLLVSTAPASAVDLFAALDRNGGICFADTAEALLKADVLSPELDLDVLADRLCGAMEVEDPLTVNRGIMRVAGGQELRASAGALQLRRWWKPADIAIVRDSSVRKAAERLRLTAEAVVDRHLPAHGPVAVQLSGGRDSSLLCALAARRLAGQGRTVHALTALPCANLPASDERYQFDESEGAVATVRRYANVEHHLFRPEPVPLATLIDGVHRQLAEPLYQPVSLSWSFAQLRRCSELGMGALLTGDDGNFTVSAGGLHSLSDVWREEGAWHWLRTSARLVGEGVTVRDLVRISFGASLPLPFYKAARKRRQPDPLFDDFSFYKGALRDKLLTLAPRNDDPRPAASHRELVRDVAARRCNLVPVGRFVPGVELLSPWNNRELFELVLALPSSMLASAPDRRKLFDEAFGDLLPSEVLRPVRRGMQNVDFHAAIDPKDLAAAIERYRESSLCRAMIDLDRLAGAAASWPTSRVNIRQFGYWVIRFLPALSMASFLHSREVAPSTA